MPIVVADLIVVEDEGNRDGGDRAEQRREESREENRCRIKSENLGDFSWRSLIRDNWVKGEVGQTETRFETSFLDVGRHLQSVNSIRNDRFKGHNRTDNFI